MPKRGLLAGNKITKNHSTIINDAVKLIEYCKTIEEVKMIVPSEIVSLKQAPRHLKFTPIQAGWKLAVRGFNARQIIYIYTSEPEVVKDLIEKWSTEFLVGCR